MDAFTTLNGLVAPLDRANVDTDQIIPKQYLKSIKRTGFGDYLFDAWRFLDQGTIGMTPNERQINRELALAAGSRPCNERHRLVLGRFRSAHRAADSRHGRRGNASRRRAAGMRRCRDAGGHGRHARFL